MTWLGQVLHVARKDVRQEAWPLTAYLAVIAIAGLAVFAPPGFTYTAVFAFIVFLLGMIVAVAVVQSDSPTASDSFWGSRPLRPTAMLGAKVLLATIIVVVPSIAQGAALLAFDANGGQAAFAIANSAKVYALWLLAAMAIAALTRDIRTFIIAFAAIFVALVLALAIWSDLWNTLRPPTPQISSGQAFAATQPTSLVGPVLWTIVAFSAAVALLAFLYRRRDARRRIWIVAIAVVLGAVSTAFISLPTRVHAAATASIPVRVEVQSSDRLGKDEQMSLHVAADTDTVSRRLILAVDRVIVHLKDGTTVTVRGTDFSSALVAAGNPFAANVRWLRSDQDLFSRFALPLSLGQRSAISKGFTGLELVGTVFAFEPRTIGTLRMEPNGSLTLDGTRLRIVSSTPTSDGGTVVIHATSLHQSEPVPFLDRFGTFGGHQYALVNQARREAVFPYRTAGGSGLNMLVLPSMPLADESATLQMKSFSGAVVRDSAWFMGARLALVQWTLRGQYSVRVPIVEVPTPPELRSQEPTIIQRSGTVEPLRAIARH